MRKRWVTLVVVLAACGPPAGKQDAEAILETQIGEIRAAAGDGDRPRAEQELKELRSRVEDLRSSDDLTEQKANRILRAADEVARYLQLIRRPRATPALRTPSPTPTPRPTPTRTQEPTPTREPEPPPTQEPEPTQTPASPGDADGDSGNDGEGGLPLLRRPG